MTDQLLQRLYKQVTAKVEKELQDEKEARIKKMMTAGIKKLMDIDMLTPEEAKSAASKYKTQMPAAKVARTPRGTAYSDVGCGAMGSAIGNRC